jgi:hypothetical protein
MVNQNKSISVGKEQAGWVGYEIRVGATLTPEIVEWLGDFALRLESNGDTVLSGYLPDQSALFGVLLRLRDLGILLVSVNPLHSNSNSLLNQ